MKPESEFGVRYHAEAEFDVYNASERYRRESPAVALQFLDAFHKRIAEIVENPEARPIMHPLGIRCARLERFPFNVFYVIDPDTVYVISVAHQSRGEWHWLSRVQP